MGVIEWEDPPDRRKNQDQHDWPGIGADLARFPRRWARVVVCPNGTAAAATARQIRDGLYVALARIGPFEAVARTVDNEPRVYARYIGEPLPEGITPGFADTTAGSEAL